MAIVLKADYRVVCPKCKWSFTVTKQGLERLLEQDWGRPPVHNKCRTRMVVEPVEKE